MLCCDGLRGRSGAALSVYTTPIQIANQRSSMHVHHHVFRIPWHYGGRSRNDAALLV